MAYEKDKVPGQPGNRVQHALRVFTPKEQNTIKAAAETFGPNPGLNITRVITEPRLEKRCYI